jgi:hypothetical protein
MLGLPMFGKWLGATDMVLGLAALVGISVNSIAMDNPNDFAGAIIVVVLPLLLGCRLFSLSRSAKEFRNKL